jgi:hypothetical protein
MNQTILLTFMLLAYIAPVAFVYYKYKLATYSDICTRSISSIITSQEPFFNDIAPLFQTRHFIAVCMFIMAAFTIAYEYERQAWSMFAIVTLLIGIFGVIFIPEHDQAHYIFAATAFFAIVGFMTGHTLCISATDADDIHDILRILLYAQFLFMLVTVIGVLQDAAIFAVEVLFLLNFAVFYLYLHYHTFGNSPSHSPSLSGAASNISRCSRFTPNL